MSSDPELSQSLTSAVKSISEKYPGLKLLPDEPVSTSHRTISEINVGIGPETVQTISLGATTSQSINPTWQVSIPSTFVLDSNIQLRLPFRFKFKGTTQAGATFRCLPVGQWCMSRYAIYQAIQSITVSLDGATLTKSIGEIMPLISDYTDLEDARSHDLYSCPDTVQSFSSLYSSLALPIAPTTA